jgi:hypothetical protein
MSRRRTGAADRVASFGMLDNRGAAAFDLGEECGTEALTL